MANPAAGNVDPRDDGDAIVSSNQQALLEDLIVRNTSLTDVSFLRQTLTSASFRTAELASVTFDDCELSDALFQRPTTSQAGRREIRDVTWSHCTASDYPISFTAAELHDCRLIASEFPRALMSGTVFHRGIIRNTNLRESTLTGATFLQTEILRGNLSNVAINRASFIDVTISQPALGWENVRAWHHRFWDALRGEYRQKWEVTIQESTARRSAFARAVDRKRESDEGFLRISRLGHSRSFAPIVRFFAAPAWYILEQPRNVFSVLSGWLLGFSIQTAGFAVIYQRASSEIHEPWMLSLHALPSPGVLFSAAQSHASSWIGAVFVIQVFLSWLIAGLFFVHIGKYTTGK